MNRHFRLGIISSFSFLAMLAAGDLPGQVKPSGGMMRYPDVSAEQIVFAYADDLWIVSRDGGMASPLASPEGGERLPRFSPDGQQIAFVGNYEGGTDIYVTSNIGGIARRMTFHPAAEDLCDWHPDGKSLLYASNGFAGLGRQPQLFTISANKPLPQKLPVPYGTNGAISDDGKWLAYTPHSRDSRTWKRYRGGMASDVWLFNLEDKTSKQITDFDGTDSLPMWLGKTVYYLSDGGTEHRLNIWAYDTTTGERRQMTKFADNDCKWPAIGPGPDGKGEIVFSNGPDLYLLNLESGASKPVPITVPGDRPQLRDQKIDASKFVESADLSPTAKRVAVGARGDIWTVPAENGSPRNLTRSSGSAERFPMWSSDGRWIAYFSDATGEYELYITQSDGRGETKQLTNDGNCYRYGVGWSPDAKHIVFCDKTGALYLYTLESNETKQIDKDPMADRIDVNWSHDANWICYAKTTDQRVPSSCIWVYNVNDGSRRKLTDGFFNDTNPVFDKKGDHMFFVSNRAFNRPKYDDIGTNFIYSGTEVLMAIPLRTDVKNPLLPKSDEETWDDADKTGKDKKDKHDDETKKDGEQPAGDAKQPEQSASDDKKDDQSDDRAVSTSSDPISGTWSVELQTTELPADERKAVMTLKLANDGTVTGTVESADVEETIVDGHFDVKSGELSFRVADKNGDADVTATVKDGKMSGTVNIDGNKIAFEATRDDTAGKTNDKKKHEPVKIEFAGIARRAFQLPVKQGKFAGLMVNHRNQLIYGTRPDPGGEEKPAIKLLDINADKVEEKTVVTGAGSFAYSHDRKHLLVMQRGDAFIIDAAPNQKLEKPVSQKGMEVMVSPRAEWKQIFWEAWRLERDFFYDPNMQGVDWKKVGEHYAGMLSDCESRSDLAFLIREMIAELNVGHAYYRPGGEANGPRGNVGLLGCRFEIDGDRYKIAELYAGADWDSDARNPLTAAGVKEGQYLLQVNETDLKTGENPYAYFQNLADQTVNLTVSDDANLDDDDQRVVVKPLSEDSELRFRGWIEQNRKYVDEKTDGKVGYIYVVNTGVPGQNDLVRQLYGQLNKEALIIDDRWNGGGQIPTRFIELLNRPVTNYWARRDGRDWPWPPDAHFGPKCMLINGMAGSGGDMFPALFRQNKLGKLIGMRTWGGLVGISGSPPLVDGAAVTVPSFAYYELDGTWGIEGHGVDPDIKVVDDPAKMTAGGDPQLDAAIEHMLRELETSAFQPPKRPAYPNRSQMGIAPEDK